MTRRDTLYIFHPAVLVSFTPGGVASFVTATDSGPRHVSQITVPQSDPRGYDGFFFRGGGLSSLELTGLVIHTPVFSSVASNLWIAIGGRVCEFYSAACHAMIEKEIVWFGNVVPKILWRASRLVIGKRVTSQRLEFAPNLCTAIRRAQGEHAVPLRLWQSLHGVFLVIPNRTAHSPSFNVLGSVLYSSPARGRKTTTDGVNKRNTCIEYPLCHSVGRCVSVNTSLSPFP